MFAIAFADSALLGMPVDAIVAIYVYQDHRRLMFYVLMASLGSALGSIPLYVVGYQGGEKVLRKRISEERFLRIHRSFEQHEFWALMFPGMLPPPMPFKIFVLGAAVFEMRFRDFLAAIFAGRFVQISGSGFVDVVVWAADCGADRDGVSPAYLLGAGGGGGGNCGVAAVGVGVKYSLSG